MSTKTKSKPSRSRIESANALEFTMGDSPLKVDREAGVIRGVKIIGNKSVNKREYPQPVLRKAIAFYEGRSVNISHPSREHVADDRPFESLFGRIENVREDESGLRGDLPYIKAHPLAEMVCEAAERFPNNFGLSQNAHVNWLVKEDGHRVCESVNKVRSVDLVCRPATTNGIFESEDATMSMPSQPAGGNGPDANPDVSAPDIKTLFMNGAEQIFDEEDTDPGEKAKRISALAKTLLKVQDDVDAAVNGEEDDDDPNDGGESVKIKEENEQLKAQLAAIQRRDKARQALIAGGIEKPSDVQIESVSVLESEEKQAALIATWKPAEKKPDASSGGGAAKPKSLPANAMESQQPANDPQPLATNGLKPRTKDQLKSLAAELV